MGYDMCLVHSPGLYGVRYVSGSQSRATICVWAIVQVLNGYDMCLPTIQGPMGYDMCLHHSPWPSGVWYVSGPQSRTLRIQYMSGPQSRSLRGTICVRATVHGPLWYDMCLSHSPGPSGVRYMFYLLLIVHSLIVSVLMLFWCWYILYPIYLILLHYYNIYCNICSNRARNILNRRHTFSCVHPFCSKIIWLYDAHKSIFLHNYFYWVYCFAFYWLFFTFWLLVYDRY